MAQWGGAVMLVVTGIGILTGWALVWLTPTRFLRRLALERCYPFSPVPMIPGLQSIIWPLAPVVGLLWIAVAARAARDIVGWDSGLETAVIVVLFLVAAAIALWRALGHEIPRWVYPGWRAERFYRRHPERAASELSGGAARRFGMRSHAETGPAH